MALQAAAIISMIDAAEGKRESIEDQDIPF